MDIQRAKRLLQIEKECITRADSCNRVCAVCDLVQDAQELLNVYDFVIAILNVIIRWGGIADDENK